MTRDGALYRERSRQQVQIRGKKAYCCPGCGEQPPRMAVYAGTEAPCENDDCLVIRFRWWQDN